MGIANVTTSLGFEINFMIPEQKLIKLMSFKLPHVVLHNDAII